MILGAILSGREVSAQQAPPPPAAPTAPPQRPSGPIEVNGIAAKVNGRVITKNQVSFMLAPVYAQLVTQFPRRGPQFEAKFKESKANIIQELIDRQIILDEFKQLGAIIKPNLIDEEIKRQMREFYNGDEVKFREELKRSRLTMDGYREMTREKMVVQAMRAQQFSDAPPPLPNEVEKEYAEIKSTLRDVSKDVISFQKIFIPASDPQNPLATPDTQLALAEDIAKQIWPTARTSPNSPRPIPRTPSPKPAAFRKTSRAPTFPRNSPPSFSKRRSAKSSARCSTRKGSRSSNRSKSNSAPRHRLMTRSAK